tara:strand:- start:27332 stop:28609 length:1278 start_codon:yes stop_codon:yes gene_type:complete
MNYPKISVIICNYNHASLLGRALDSVLEEEDPIYEIIVVDDGSTDDSQELIQAYADRYPHIKFIAHDENKGCIDAVNTGIDASTGEYIVFRAADDLNYPGFIGKAVEMLEVYPEAALCCGDAAYFGNDPDYYQVEPMGLSAQPTYFNPDTLARAWNGHILHGHTVVVRAKALGEFGYWLPETAWYSDWFCFMILAMRHGLCYIPQPAAKVRLSSQTYCSANAIQREKQHEIMRTVLKKLKTSYRDILPRFMQSGALAFFGPEMVDSIMAQEVTWDAETMLLLQRNLEAWNTRKTQAQDEYGITPVIEGVLERHSDAVEKIASQGRIAVYGMGVHTEALINVWLELDLPFIDCLLVSHPTTMTSCWGIPVVSVTEIEPSFLDLVVVSSKPFEASIVAQCQEHLPEVPLLTFWDTTLTSLSPFIPSA